MTTQHFFLSAWSMNPVVWGVGVVATAWYARKVGFDLRWRTASFLTGVMVFILALASPLDELANGYLFSAHMLQHLLLLLIVPPLILLGLPFLTEVKEETSFGAKYLFFHPFIAWLMGVGAMWLWHYPSLCNASTQDPWVHRLQYISLLIMGALFWLPIFGGNLRHRLSPLIGMAYLFTACMACTLLGVLITFSPITVCSVYAHPVDRLGILSLIRDGWGFTPGKDQQLGGLLMWVPACMIYLSFILGLLLRWFRQPQAHEIPASPAMR